MTTRELPPPLRTENDAAAHLDDVLCLEDIVEGCLVLTFCEAHDDHLQPLATALLGELPHGLTPRDVCDRWVAALTCHGGVPPAVVFARAREGRSYVLDDDRAWHEAMLGSCREHDLVLEAAFVVTQHAVIPFPAPLSPDGA